MKSLLLFLFPMSPVRIMYDFDLASLHSMAEAIVMVPWVSEDQWAREGWDRFITIKVEKSYKGSLEKGASVKVEVSSYSFRNQMGFAQLGSAWEEPPGSILLFLGAEEKCVRRPVPSGIKLIGKDAVWGFRQMMNPGPYGVMLMKRERGTKEEREKPFLAQDLEADLKEAGEHAKEFEGLVSIAETPRRIASLLEFLRREPARIGGDDDPCHNRSSSLIYRAAMKIAESKERVDEGLLERTKEVTYQLGERYQAVLRLWIQEGLRRAARGGTGDPESSPVHRDR